MEALASPTCSVIIIVEVEGDKGGELLRELFARCALGCWSLWREVAGGWNLNLERWPPEMGPLAPDTGDVLRYKYTHILTAPGLAAGGAITGKLR